MTACFTGHRTLTDNEALIRRRTCHVIRELCQSGVTRFFCGGALGFDLLAAECVLALKKELPSLRLLIAVPCKTQARLWPQAQQERYAEVLAAADEVRVLSGAYYRGCMLVRNRYMVDRSSVCICYLTQMKGGTMYTATYAAKEDLRLINIALTDENKPLEPFRKSDKYLSDRLD